MPHAGELLSLTGTLRGDGVAVKRDLALRTVDADFVLYDELGNALLDQVGLALTEF